MILHHKDINIKENDIFIQKPLQYSNQFIFYPIKYKKKEFIIQTPRLFLLNGIKHYSTINSKKYIDLSFQNKHLDKSIQVFQENLITLFNKVYKSFQTKYTIEPFIKDELHFQKMRFKVNNTCLFFDQQKI